METDIENQIKAIEAELEGFRRQRAKLDQSIDTDERELKRLKAIVSRTLYGIARGDTLIITDECYKELQQRGPKSGFTKASLDERWAVGHAAIVEHGNEDTFYVWCNHGGAFIQTDIVVRMREAFLDQFGVE